MRFFLGAYRLQYSVHGFVENYEDEGLRSIGVVCHVPFWLFAFLPAFFVTLSPRRRPRTFAC